MRTKKGIWRANFAIFDPLYDVTARAARRYWERKRRMSLKRFNVNWVLTL